MAVTYAAALKTARMTATRDACADGTIELLTAGNAVVVIHGLSATGGTVAGSVWTLALDAAAVAATAAGVVTQARVKNAGGTVMISGLTVTDNAGAGDVRMQNTNVAVGQDVTISSFTITHAN